MCDTKCLTHCIDPHCMCHSQVMIVHYVVTSHTFFVTYMLLICSMCCMMQKLNMDLLDLVDLVLYFTFTCGVLIFVDITKTKQNKNKSCVCKVGLCREIKSQ